MVRVLTMNIYPVTSSLILPTYCWPPRASATLILSLVNWPWTNSQAMQHSSAADMRTWENISSFMNWSLSVGYIKPSFQGFAEFCLGLIFIIFFLYFFPWIFYAFILCITKLRSLQNSAWMEKARITPHNPSPCSYLCGVWYLSAQGGYSADAQYCTELQALNNQ